MLIKEYRICMPLSVDEYKIGQLYMVAKHSSEQSQKGEGVEVVRNEACEHEQHGKGQYTEKRVHLSSRLPTWLQSFIPKIFYVTEKAWNYYPYTITEYTCSFIPKFSVCIETRYEDNNGSSDNCLSMSVESLAQRTVDIVDIVNDPVPEKHFKEEEDLSKFKSKKTSRGPFDKKWMEATEPIMCSYKLVKVKFEVWGLQTKVESFTQKSIRDILLLGHKQAFAWIDEWIGMTEEDVREYEKQMQEETNKRVLGSRSGSTSSH
ncbi:cytoplasmic phosphatidylinositol transfer protein 1 [Patella vulgata]|uniref:cytoplasmic phosphatidylinositol transfer protein 1 n=1 Tax=Patella vulgata TaxID=6465 RepID=UPI0024A8FE19|nr:cytoplasmic phosphatidylinositol transfer protein 1 [Patella vulgata]